VLKFRFFYGSLQEAIKTLLRQRPQTTCKRTGSADCGLWHAVCC